MLGRQDINIRTTVQKYHFTDDEIFSGEEGLKIAIAFTSYNNDREYELPKEYGELIFNSFSWGLRENGEVFTERLPLEHHECTREELSFYEHDEDREHSHNDFFPVYDNSRWIVSTYQKKF